MSKKNDDWFKKFSESTQSLENTVSGKWPAWSTGLFLFDYASGIGGLPKGKIVEVYGKPSSGKSALCMTAAGFQQRKGKKIVFIDFERSINSSWTSDLGLDIDDPNTFLRLYPNHLEQAFELMIELIKLDADNQIAFFIIDSIAAAQTKEEKSKKSLEDPTRLGTLARALKELLPPLENALEANNCESTVMFINHLRQNINAGMYEPQWKTPGGTHISHSATMRLNIGTRGKITKDLYDEFTGEQLKAEPIGHEVVVKFDKSKISSNQNRRVYLDFVRGKGFDNIRMVIDACRKRGFFGNPSSAWLTIPAEFTGEQDVKVQGKEKLFDTFKRNQNMFMAATRKFYEEVKKTTELNNQIIGEERWSDNLYGFEEFELSGDPS